MKSILLSLLYLTFSVTNANAQLSRLGNKVKSKVDQRVDRRVDTEIDKALDMAEGKSASSNTESASTTATKETTPSPVAEKTPFKSYAKYDFVPGEKIIYSNQFETDNLGELPTGWNSTGNAAVVTLNNINGNWLQLYQNVTTLTDNKTPFTENCTIEFDLIVHQEYNGWGLPQIAFGFINTGKLSTTDNKLFKNRRDSFSVEIDMQPGTQNNTHLQVKTFERNSEYLSAGLKDFKQFQNFYDKPVHVAIQIQKERLRIWMNEEKLYDLPKAIAEGTILNQMYFLLKQSNYADEKVGYYIGNIKIAKGLPDTRSKLVEEGKFSTTGILFDVNAATIKPESNGVLKEIADVLKKYTDMKIKIIGHTDSDGTDADNLELSKKRAAAVKEALINNFGIAADRMDTDGKGEKENVADNKTREGKSQNRRVEFIKQ